MFKLMSLRLFIKRNQIVNGLAAYCIVFGILFSFLLLLLMMYDNKVGELYEIDFHYVLTYFDERNIQELRKHDGVEKVYSSRIVTSTISKSGKETEIDVHLVDEWDEDNLSFWGENRSIMGNVQNRKANSIILDVMTARKLHAGIGNSIEIAVGNDKIEYEVVMLVKPDFNFGDGFAVCLYNDLFTDKWGQYFEESPCYSLMFVRAQDTNGLDTYFYDEYVGPDMENESIERRRQVNRSSVIKKEWMLSDAEKEMEYTPPVTIIISMIGMLFVVLFTWRENAWRLDETKKDIAILTMQGMAKGKIINCFCICQTAVMALAIILAGILVKLMVYDLLIDNYYLSWELLGVVLLLSIVISIFFSYLTVYLLCNKIYRQPLQKWLAGE